MPRRFLLLALLSAFAVSAFDPTADIRKVLADQQAAWNRGDVDAFMQGYADSPDTLFIGKAVTRGHAAVLESYRKRYPTHDAMGTLEFTMVEVRMLGGNNAFVTGRFHLARTQAGGGEAQGIFSLVFERKPEGWKIILDHTS